MPYTRNKYNIFARLDFGEGELQRFKYRYKIFVGMSDNE